METGKLTEFLLSTPLFSMLSEAEIADVLTHCRVRECARGTLLFREGETYRGFYIVLEGAVKVFKLSPDGKETVLHILFPPQTLAEIPMFAGSDYPAHAETLHDSVVVFVGKEGFLDLLRTNPTVSLRMLAGLSKRLRTLATQLEELTAFDVRTRLLHYLLQEYRHQQPGPALSRITLRVPKSLIAAHLGATLETLSRTFRKLEDEGLIAVKGKTVLLHDVERIEQEYQRSSGR